MKDYKTNFASLKNLLEKIKGSIRNCESNKKKIFAIGSTATGIDKYSISQSYQTPTRETDRYLIFGVVVYTQSQALYLLSEINDLVDIVLVDAEKKIPMIIDSDISFLSKDLQNIIKEGNKSNSLVETGNLSAVCFAFNSSKELYTYKANDIAVDATMNYLNYVEKNIEGKKVAIIGAGNIGSKLALKLVEIGAMVTINKRNHDAGYKIAESLNLIKPRSTISYVKYFENINQACFQADFIIGSCDSGAINVDDVSVAKKNVVLIDVGKGAFSSNTIEYSIRKSLSLYRVDVSNELEYFINSLMESKNRLKNTRGKKTFKGLVFVSGGEFGLHEEVIVDDFKFLKKIFGLADGKGDLIRKPNKHQLEILKLASKVINE